MKGEPVPGSVNPFTDSIKDLDDKKESTFMGRRVKTGFVVLVFDDGTAVRGGISIVGEGSPEHYMLASKIIHETLEYTFGEVPTDARQLN